MNSADMKNLKSSFPLFLLLILFVLQLPITIVGSYVLSAFYSLFGKRVSGFSDVKIATCAVLCLFFLVPVLLFNHGPTPLLYLMLSPFLCLMAYKFSRESIDTVEGALKYLYWIFLFLIAIALVVFRDEPEPLGAILPWASTNGIPSYLIVVQIALSLAYYLNHDRLPILSTICTLIVAVYGLGRGSMIVGLLLVFLSVFVNIYIAKSDVYRCRTKRAVAIIMVAVSILLMLYYDYVISSIDLWIEGSKFSGGVLDEHRGKIISDYLGKIEGFELLFGADYENTSITQNYGGNPHNSYIRIHSFYGILGLIIVFIPLFMVFFSRREVNQKIVLFLFVLMALLRATSETIFFPSTLDFFYMLYFFMFFRFSRSVNKG